MSSVNSYCDNNGEIYFHFFAVKVTIMTITGRSICSVNKYCDNKVVVYIQC